MARALWLRYMRTRNNSPMAGINFDRRVVQLRALLELYCLTHRYRWQASSPKGFGCCRDFLSAGKFCGSWLASDGAGSDKLVLPDPPLSLASQLPQGFWVLPEFMSAGKFCGSWLASDEAGSGKLVLPDPLLSLASQLPQGFWVLPGFFVRRQILWELACQRWGRIRQTCIA